MPGASLARRITYRAVMEPGSLVMERKMLVEIRERAESCVAVREPLSA